MWPGRAPGRLLGQAEGHHGVALAEAEQRVAAGRQYVAVASTPPISGSSVRTCQTMAPSCARSIALSVPQDSSTFRVLA